MLLSLSMLLLVTIWGVRSVSGVLIAGLGFYLIPYFLNDNYSWLYLLTGLGAIGISRNPEGVIGDLVTRFVRRWPGFADLGRTRVRSLAPSSPSSAAVGSMTSAVIDGER
jgi:hypothetical protein